MKERIVISFDQKEAMWVERIALDRDREEALHFIEKILLKKIKDASRPH